MEVQTAPTAGILRRSCHFCRGRKIRCSGSSICSACQERNIDCVYDVQSGKGRPKGRGSKSSAKTAQSAPRSKQSSPELVQINTATKSHEPVEQAVSPSTQNQTIDQALSFVFEENFMETIPKSNINLFQKTIADFHRQLRRDPAHVAEMCGYDLEKLDRTETIPYDSMLSNIRGEMMAMIASRFGSLGCEFKQSGSRNSYLRGLIVDNTTAMFDPSYQGENPLARLDHHRILQLIDTWFSNHPLSPLISKTLLLTSLKSNTADKALLAIIIGDALTAHGNAKIYAGASEQQEAFYQYATTLIKARPASCFKITTVQSFCLLGFRDLTNYKNRRATCWLGYASRAVSELDEQMRQGELRNHQRMNGVEVGTVEREIVRNMHWITFATTFWAMSQIGAPFTAIIPKSFGVDFPPVNESFSSVIGLDMASDNISTLLSQSRSLREFWPLSHIVCSLTHICALDTQRAETDDGTHGAAWQSKHLLKLRKLLNFDTEVSAICVKVCEILQEAILEVEREIHDNYPKSIVICAYRTIICQLLFPKGGENAPITTRMVSDLCYAMAGVSDIAATIAKSTLTPGAVPRDLVSTTPVAETLALCLDACSRALQRLAERAASGTDADYMTISEFQDALAVSAQQLHEVSKLDISRTVSFMRPVKRRLKDARLAFSTYATIRNGSMYPHQNMSTTSGSLMPLHAMTGNTSPQGEVPAFMPSLECSAPNSGVGTPVLEQAQLSLYSSPMLSTATPHQEQLMHEDYFVANGMAYHDVLNAKYPGYAPQLPADPNAWLYLQQQQEPIVYEKRPSFGRTSVTSAPMDLSDMQYTTHTTMHPDAMQFSQEERYW